MFCRPRTLDDLRAEAAQLHASARAHSSDPRAPRKTSSASDSGLRKRYDALSSAHAELKDELRQAKLKLQAREAEFERARTELTGRVQHLKQRLDWQNETLRDGSEPASAEVDDRSAAHLGQLRTLHRSIQDTIGEIKGRTEKIMQEQERDLVRSFKRQLADMSEELEKERRKNESGSVEWVQRCKKLTEELEWLRATTERLNEEKRQLTKENRRYKRKITAQQEDREFLIKQLVGVKKENARLRDVVKEHEEREGELQRTMAASLQRGSGGEFPVLQYPQGDKTSALQALRQLEHDTAESPSKSTPKRRSRPQSAAARRGAGAAPMDASLEQRYKNVMAKLKRQVEQEQRKCRKLRAAYNNEIRSRTELEKLFSRCVEDVRRKYGLDGVDVTGEQRAQMLEAFLTDDRVASRLHSALFPESTPPLDVHLRSSGRDSAGLKHRSGQLRRPSSARKRVSGGQRPRAHSSLGTRS